MGSRAACTVLFAGRLRPFRGGCRIRAADCRASPADRALSLAAAWWGAPRRQVVSTEAAAGERVLPILEVPQLATSCSAGGKLRAYCRSCSVKRCAAPHFALAFFNSGAGGSQVHPVRMRNALHRRLHEVLPPVLW